MANSVQSRPQVGHANIGTGMQDVVSIREANQLLSRYLERVEGGAEVVITRGGEPIARLSPHYRRHQTLQRPARRPGAVARAHAPWLRPGRATRRARRALITMPERLQHGHQCSQSTASSRPRVSATSRRWRYWTRYPSALNFGNPAENRWSQFASAQSSDDRSSSTSRSIIGRIRPGGFSENCVAYLPCSGCGSRWTITARPGTFTSQTSGMPKRA